jgi:hypothetical protein
MVEGNENIGSPLDKEDNHTRKQTKEIKNTIRTLEKELDTIQSSCLHKESEIRNCQNENRGFSLRRVCILCEKEIGYPTQIEIDNWSGAST